MAFRLNLMGIGTHVEDRDAVKNDRWGVAPSFAIGLGQPTTLVLNYLHQQEDDIPDFGIPVRLQEAGAVCRVISTMASAPTTGCSRMWTSSPVASTNDFNDWISVTETGRVGNYDYLTRQTAPHYGKTAPTVGTPLGSILVYADRPNQGGVVKTAESDTDFTFKFSHRPLQAHA